MKYTGTCAVCGNKQKVKNNKMVHHGYSKNDGFWTSNSCPGTKCDAIEISDEGLNHYITVLESYLERLPKQIEEYQFALDSDTDKNLNSYYEALKLKGDYSNSNYIEIRDLINKLYDTCNKSKGYPIKVTGAAIFSSLFDLERSVKRSQEYLIEVPKRIQSLKERIANWKAGSLEEIQ